MELILTSLQGLFSSIGPFFILLGLLIFVHELGHFMVAKFFGVRVEVFSLGFGKKILQYQKGETNYCISLIPLGGYVKMFGDDPSQQVPDSEKPRAFLHKPVGPRIAIVLAGPLMNLFFAAFLFFIIAMIGDQQPGTTLGDIQPDTIAFQNGFRSGDKISTINGDSVQLWSEVKERIEDHSGQSLHFKVARADSEVDVMATPEQVTNDIVLSPKEKVGRIQGLTNEAQSTLIAVGNPKSLAYQAGLRSLDLIEKINGKEVNYFRDLPKAFAEHLATGSTLKLEVRSYTSEKTPPPKTIEIVATGVKANSPTVMGDLGIEDASLYLLRVKKKSPADKAGMTPGDKITHINGEAITAWQQVVDKVVQYKDGEQPLKFSVVRTGQPVDIQVTPEMTELMNMQGQEEQRLTIGIVPGLINTTPPPILYKATSVGEGLRIGLHKSIEWTELVVMSLVRLVQAEVSAKNIGGVITIGKFASQSFEVGIAAFLKMMAIISINLFLLNLLPVPVLDGGHLVFFTIEALRGAPVSLRKMEIAQQVGMLILISLMAFAFFNDISNLFRSPW